MTSPELIESLRRALEFAPNDIALRQHLMQLLETLGRHNEAVEEAERILKIDSGNADALRVVNSIRSPPSPNAPTDDELALREMATQLGEIASSPVTTESESPLEPTAVTVTFADVGGMADVKERLEAAFVVPLRHPELRDAFGSELRGGIMLYGPPGCGKTYLGKALAGELGARFLSVSITDVVTMWFGESEKNVHSIFELARKNAPVVLFFDEIDALGFKRSRIPSAVGRGVINQLLAELDGVASNNFGIFVVGSTNHPWDVDVALRRPGRFDRMMLVLPPDHDARETILGVHLRDRRVGALDLPRLADMSEGLSGADLAYACRRASEDALVKSSKAGAIIPIEQRDLETALSQVVPSVLPWLEMAKNVVRFANTDGSYDELKSYLTLRKML